MDIYAYAEEWGADYMDMSTGNVYKCQKYMEQKRKGIEDPKIEVYNGFGRFIGYAKKKEER